MIAFIIPHKGRFELLVQTISSIWALQRANNNNPHKDTTLKIEVIVVSQNEQLSLNDLPCCDDQAIDSDMSEIKLFHQSESLTISALRNFGSTQTDAEYLAFLDADVSLSSNWLMALLPQLNDQVVLVSAVQTCLTDAPVLEKIRTVLSNAETDCFVRFLPGRNLLMKHSTFERVGGFPEHLVTCEDYYFTDQVNTLGKLRYSAAAEYIHLGEDKQFNEMFHKEIWRGQSNIQSIKGRKIPLSEVPSFLVPIWIALFSLSFFVSLIFLRLDFALINLIFVILPIVLYTNRLHRIGQNKVSYWHILKFYLVYFPARIIGTFGGLFKTIQIKPFG